VTAATEHAAAVTRAVPAGTRWIKHAAAAIPPLLCLILVAAVWQFMASSLHSPLVPPLAEIGSEFGRLIRTGLLFPQIAATLERVALGFTLAFVIAVAAGIAMGRVPWMRRFLEPAVLIGLTVPGLVWALLCVIWFGVSLANPVVAVALSAAPAIALTVAQGVRGVDADLVEMAYVFRFSRSVQLHRLWLPALAPHLLSACRFGLSLAWKVIVLVEIFGMSSGVGYQLSSAFSSQNVATMLAWTLSFGVVMAILEYGLLQSLERYLTRWRRESNV
jgi:NitT/TauT family transport system permease protein